MSRTYHHGDLRRALVDAAVEMLNDGGSGALTLRAVARHAKVSHQAPYNHFADIDDLFAAVAREGFLRLASTLRRVQARHRARPLGALRETGVAYTVFAVRHTAHWRLMFGARFANRARHPELAASADEVFALLSAPVVALSKGVRLSISEEGLASGDPRVILWSVTHGLAQLLIDGQLGPIAARSVPAYVRRALDALSPLARRAGGA
jgi:AcrR family transcriptional regulator